MSDVMVDTSYPESDRAMRLCRMLGNQTADALPVRLWCWGIKTERENGRFEADAKQLAQIVRFDGDPPTLLDAFLSCDVIEKTETPHVFRISGWKRNAKYFRERERLRELRRTQKARVQNASGTQKARVENKPSSSSSSSSSLNTNTARARDLLSEAAKEFDDRAELDPRATKEPRSTRQLEVFAEAAWIEREQARGLPGIALDESGRRQLGQIIRTAAAAKVEYSRVFDEWFRDEWREAFGWSLAQLAKRSRDVVNALSDPKLRPKPKPKSSSDLPEGYRHVPSPDETRARIQAEQAAIAEAEASKTPEDHAREKAWFDEQFKKLGVKR